MNGKSETETTTGAAPEVANIAVESRVNGLKIGKAIVAKGRVEFPLTATQAKELEALEKVTIIGVWK